MKIAQWNYLGPRSTPQEVRDLRKSSFDHHRELGQAIVHKHKWTLKDVREGRTRMCPLHDETLDGGDSAWDPYCFGTGILGGWADGVITFISIADTQEDRIRFGPEGVLLFETHPNFTAPWVPEMADGDFIITADFKMDTWDIVEEFERYDLQEVTPKTMRGFKKNQRGYRVHQQGNLDKIPEGDYRYNVPIVFDYGNVPSPGPIPPGGDPTDYPIPPVGGYVTAFTKDVRITGDEPGLRSYRVQDTLIVGFGDSATRTQSVSITGTSSGTHVIFEEGY